MYELGIIQIHRYEFNTYEIIFYDLNVTSCFFMNSYAMNYKK